MSVRRERSTIERIVGGISLAIFLKTVLEIGLKSQDELDDLASKFVILSRVAGIKEKRGVRVASGGQGSEKFWCEG